MHERDTPPGRSHHRPHEVSTTPASSTTRAASRSWSTCWAGVRTPCSISRSSRCATSSTAAPQGAEAETGDGAGILIQMPDALLPCRGRLRAPAGRRVRDRHGVPRARRRDARGRPARRRRQAARRRGLRAPRPARGADRHRGHRRRPSGRCRPSSRSSWRRTVPAAADGHRARAARVRRAQADRARGRRLPPVAVDPHLRLQGHADGAAAAGLLPRPLRSARRVGAVPRALAVLDQHLPELAARAPVPGGRPQRRDQHRPGQRELDAGA